jgi:predicted ATP-dependent Lon-type protease
VDENNPKNGSFELDWNEFFVAKLVKSGYTGRDDNQIIDQWFQDVCRHVVLETYEQYEANNPKVRRKDMDNGRAEYS